MATEYVLRVAALRRAAEAAKLLIHPAEDGGFMVLRGTVRVKWNPRTLRCNVDGQGIGWKERDPANVVRAAIEGPPRVDGYSSKDRDSDRGTRKKLRKIRMRMHRTSPKCYWCRSLLEFDESTIDHRIPLARGGSDNPNNLVLSCGPCNHARGAHVGSPRSVAERRGGSRG